MNYKSPISQKKQYFYLGFFILFSLTTIYISGLHGFLSLILSLCIYSLVLFFIYSLWKKLWKKQSLPYLEFGEYFLYKVSLGLLFSIIILGSFSYYKNEISPSPMPTYHLTNGEKQVVFQAMSHIGTPAFYKTIQQNLTQKKQEGYVYYFEGVKPGNEENTASFDKAIGVKFDENLYENFSKLYGVVHQDNSLYFNLINNKDFNIDLSIDEIMQEYNKKTSNSPTALTATSSLQEDEKEVIDINSQVIETLSSLNNKELSLLRYINKAILNFMIGSEGTQNLVMDNFANKKLFSIILDKRNEVLADEIINSEHDKIFITYGLLHFKGVLNILQSADSEWKITKTDELYPIQ